jgi:GNAT superfamily N-acetyltransferase
MYEEFIGKYAEENPDIADGLEVKYWSNDTNDLKDVDSTKWHLEVIDPKSEDVVGSISFEYEQRGGFFDGTKDVDGLVVRDISVNVQPKYRGKNYQHLLYSEMFERARATGAIGFTQNIENKLGLPLKSVNKIVGKDGSKIWTLANWDPAEPTQENFDKMMAVSPKIRTGGGLLKEFVQNNGRLDPNARYMPSEFTEFSSEQSATGRILRNAKGYVIMLSNNKFRVYNPMKAIIGVYATEEEAKKRIYKEIPKQ